VLATWAGIRPLIAEEGKSPSDISRKDELWTGAGGMISIAGGKLTAYRQMAEDVADKVEKALGRKPTKSRTETTPLISGDVDVAAMGQKLRGEGLADHEADRLLQLYGAEALEALGGPGAEARRAVTREGAVKLEDYWVRRSARAWYDADAGLGALEPAARVMGELLGWSDSERDEQIAACKAIHEASMAFQTGG